MAFDMSCFDDFCVNPGVCVVVMSPYGTVSISMVDGKSGDFIWIEPRQWADVLQRSLAVRPDGLSQYRMQDVLSIRTEVALWPPTAYAKLGVGVFLATMDDLQSPSGESARKEQRCFPVAEL